MYNSICFQKHVSGEIVVPKFSCNTCPKLEDAINPAKDFGQTFVHYLGFINQSIQHHVWWFLFPEIMYIFTIFIGYSFLCYNIIGHLFGDVLSKTTKPNLLISFHEEVCIDLNFIYLSSLITVCFRHHCVFPP